MKRPLPQEVKEKFDKPSGDFDLSLQTVYQWFQSYRAELVDSSGATVWGNRKTL